jgi:hypothetical protein
MPPQPQRRSLQPLSARSGNFDFPPASDESIGSLTARFQTLRDTLQQEREDLNLVRELTAADRASFQAVLNHPAFNMLPRSRRRRLQSTSSPQPLTIESLHTALSDDRNTRRLSRGLRSTLQSPPPPSSDSRSNEPRSLRRPRERPLLPRLADDDVAFLRDTEESLSQTASELPTVSAHLRTLRAQLRDVPDDVLPKWMDYPSSDTANTNEERLGRFGGRYRTR